MYPHNVIYKLNIGLNDLVLSLSPNNISPVNNSNNTSTDSGLQGPIPLCLPIKSCYVH